MRWTFHIEGGPRRVNHAAVCIGSKIFSFGGYSSTDEYKDWDPISVHVLDTTTLRWSIVNYEKTDVIPFQRYGHTTVVYKDKVFMWGGRNNAVACDTLCCFNIKTCKWSTPQVTGNVPYAKDGHSACVINNKMYIFGGFEYVSDQYSQDVHYLDLDKFVWYFIEASGPIPSARDFHTAVSINNNMYLFGGRGDRINPNLEEELYCPQLCYLDTIEEKWVSVNADGDCPGGRRSHSAWTHEGYMYIFGGYNGNTKEHLNSLYRYSIKENIWQCLSLPGNVPCKRRRQACILHKDKVYLFGGTRPRCHGHVQVMGERNYREKLMDSNDLHVLDYSPTLKILCILTVLEHDLDQSCLPHDILLDIDTMTLPNHISTFIIKSK